MSFDTPDRTPSENVISVSEVGKHYLIYERPEDRFKQMVAPRLQRLLGQEPRLYYREFVALSDVSFDVKRGETVGVVGRNGAGKSTLLQIVCGTLSPSSGAVEVNGRIAALLELGSGFNREFTGRENVFLNAAILGLSREEIEARFDSIAAFADIGEFIDYPVKTYSSGMYVRLAFAVQAQIDPDVLVVDEALAVGDARFQNKCFNRLKELKKRGTSILLVTHSTEQVVTHCDRVILLEGGKKVDDGEPRPVVNRYLDLLYGQIAARSESSSSSSEAARAPRPLCPPGTDLQQADPDFVKRADGLFSERPAYNRHEQRLGDQRGEIIDFLLFADSHSFPPTITSGSLLTLYVRYRLLAEVVRPICGFVLKTKEGVTLYGTNTEVGTLSGEMPRGNVGQEFILRFECKLPCAGGDYFLSLGLASRDVNGTVVPHDRRYDSIHLHVQHERHFFGLSDFRATMSVYSET